MKLIRSLFLSSLLLTIIFITGCNEGPTTSVDPINTGVQLSKFSLPPGETLTSATLHIYIIQDAGSPNNEEVNIYQVNTNWIESEVTWNTKPAVSGTAEKLLHSDAAGWKTVDITALVQKWLDGTSPNYGLLLDQISETVGSGRTNYDSREATNKPYLSIVHSGGNAIVEDIADAKIWALHPDEKYGSSPLLSTGYVNGYEKQSLLKFDIEYVPDGGCTLTPGYWKTHSKYGPAPYDDTWEQIGEDATFFLSGQSYYQVLWTSPAGNAYYNLSFHYIAAKLNFLNGADPSAAQAAFDEATKLFDAYTPAQIAALSNKIAADKVLRAKFISLAGILGQYNEGYIGPGHCD